MKEYYEIDRGRFDSFLMHEDSDLEIAYTDGDEVRIGRGFVEDRDSDAVEEFASQYDCTIVK